MTTHTIFTDNYKVNYPMVTNNFAYGLTRKPKTKALDYRFLETTPNRAKNIMTFDLDIEDAENVIKTKAWDDQTIPEPNWATFNPGTGHAHIGYVLKGTIGSVKGIQFYKDVRTRLNPIIGGDNAYNGFTTRNPLTQPTLWVTDHLYSLKELAEYAPKLTTPKLNKEDNPGQGRNDLLFNALKEYAYRAYRRLEWNTEALRVDLEAKALELYYSDIEDHNTFPMSEVVSIVRSVHKWVIKHFSKEQFSRIQSQRAKKRWGDHVELNDPFIIMLREELGFTFNEMADNLGLTPGGAKTAYYRAKKRKQVNDNI